MPISASLCDDQISSGLTHLSISSLANIYEILAEPLGPGTSKSFTLIWRLKVSMQTIFLLEVGLGELPCKQYLDFTVLFLIVCLLVTYDPLLLRMLLTCFFIAFMPCIASTQLFIVATRSPSGEMLRCQGSPPVFSSIKGCCLRWSSNGDL